MNASDSQAFAGLTQAHFDRLAWPTILEAGPQKDCSTFRDLFRDKAKALEGAGETDLARASRALQAVCALQMQLDNRRQPFQGWCPMAGFKCPGPEDFGEPLLAILADLARQAREPDFTARLADLCWSTQKKRHFPLVAIAIEAYLAAADALSKAPPDEPTGHRLRRWETAVTRIKRALQLALMTKHGLLNSVQATIDDLLRTSSQEIPSRELGDLLATYQNELDGDPAWLISIAQQAADRADAAKQWDSMRHLLRLQANWEKKAGLLQAAVRTEERRAESYLRDATANPTSHGSARWISRSITAYQAISPKSPRIDALKRLMTDLQKRGMGEMQTVSFPVDSGIDPALIFRHIAGQTLQIALFRLATIHRPLDEESIHQSVLARSHDPWFALSSEDLIDWDGRVIARRGSVISEDTEVRTHAIRAEMFRSALNSQKEVLHGFIEPARLQLLSEHNPGFQDFYCLLVDSPFIPPGREPFFVRGLYEGLLGDFLISAHLLIPQLEHALRFHLERQGVDVTTLSEGVQERMDLNKLFGLRRKELLAIFGGDQVFELEGLLIRRYGANLRNSFAHGLFWPDQFFDSSVVYLWWMTLRLCVLHLLPDSMTTPAAGAEGDPAGPASTSPDAVAG